MTSRRDEPTPDDTRRPRTFVCRDDLYGAFEARARELECSVDWLLGEAMRRLLKSDAKGASALPGEPRRPSLLPRSFAAPLPLPRPPPPRRPTGSFAGPKPVPSASPAPIALRSSDARAIVDRDRFVIGRSAKESHFALRDGAVSRQHAIIERSGASWVIVDMASTNGVHVNGVRVTRAPIRAGDLVEIGPFSIAVEPA
ncbi:MAG: FHA domain-containing protein [Deltaproteobacteria bacterium]|nr:FHA domain-containing protein [Deltaproteobacteria bacterium]